MSRGFQLATGMWILKKKKTFLTCPLLQRDEPPLATWVSPCCAGPCQGGAPRLPPRSLQGLVRPALPLSRLRIGVTSEYQLGIFYIGTFLAHGSFQFFDQLREWPSTSWEWAFVWKTPGQPIPPKAFHSGHLVTWKHRAELIVCAPDYIRGLMKPYHVEALYRFGRNHGFFQLIPCREGKMPVQVKGLRREKNSLRLR